MASSDFKLSFADNATNSTSVEVAGFERGSIGPLPVGFVTSGITWYVSNDDVTFTALKDSAGSAVVAIAAQEAGFMLAFNENVFNFRFARLAFDSQTGGPLTIPGFLTRTGP